MERLELALKRCREFATIDYLGMTIEMDFDKDDGSKVTTTYAVGGMFTRIGDLIYDGLEDLYEAAMEHEFSGEGWEDAYV